MVTFLQYKTLPIHQYETIKPFKLALLMLIIKKLSKLSSGMYNHISILYLMRKLNSGSILSSKPFRGSLFSTQPTDL